MSWSFEAGNRIGSSKRFELIAAYSTPGVWRTRDYLSGQNCRLRVLSLPLPQQIESDVREREKQRLTKEFEKWREINLARPETIDFFWEGNFFCWVEELVKGAPLSSLNGVFTTIDALSLIEEVLYILDDHQSHTDFMTGEPLLHLNIHPSTIMRSEKGPLYLMDPLSPLWIQLKAQHTKQRLDELDGAHPPEFTRGRCESSSDLYALGMSTLSAMTQMSLKWVDQRLNAGRLLSQDLTLAPSVQAFFEGLIHFRASERFTTPAEALRVLRDLPREVYEPLGRLLERTPPPYQSPIQSVPQVQERLATVRVDDFEDALNSIESEIEGDLDTFSLPHQSASMTTSDSLGGEAIIAQDESASREVLLIDHDPGSTQTLEINSALSFYTRAHEPRLPQQREASGNEDHFTEVEVVENRKMGGLLWFGLPLLALMLWLWMNSLDSSASHKLLIKTQKKVLKSDASARQKNPQNLESKAYLASQDPLSTTLPSAQAIRLIEVQKARVAPLPLWRKLEGGEVWIGALEGEGYADEHPRRKVKVEAFEMSQTEVTVRQYTKCVDGGACDLERVKKPDWGEAQQCNWNYPERLDHPMNCVSWRQALDYAKWAGGRLPSEAEWSYAAQGGRNAPKEGLRYPWGQQSKGCGYAILHHHSRGDGCGQGGTAPVCSVAAGDTAQGLCDLIGNVWEWMTDEYHANYQDAPVDGTAWALFPLDRWSQVERSLRGAAFDERDLPRIARRNHYGAELHLATVGFRLVRDLSQTAPQDLSRPIAPSLTDQTDIPSSERLLKPTTN